MATDTFYSEKNGGFNAYPDRVQNKVFFRASDRYTKTVTVLSGQVLKAFTFLETDLAGKSIANAGGTISGVLAFDVDASAGDVKATAYTEASFWADALVWAVNTGTDTITLADGTTVAVTAYDTGASGTTEASNLLKQQFVEGSGFTELGFLSAGETA